ncbi:MAG: hypothetical protein RIC95_11780 [Vicingaceae bacterium]
MKRNNTKQLRRWSTLCFIFLFSIAAKAQYIEQYPINENNGDKMFEFKNYPEAVRQFSELLKEEPNNIVYKFKLGKAYTLSLIDQAKGLKLLEEVAESANLPEDLKVDETLALAYFKNYKFDKALSLYEKLKSSALEEERKTFYQSQIELSKRAKKLYQDPVPVQFENLGENINSKAPDYLPFISPDESLIFFTTRREGVVGGLYDYKGYYTADIYTSRHRRNKYNRSRSVGSPNTYGNEETAGRSEDGSFMLYHVDSDDHFSNIFVSEKGRRSYMAPKVIGSEEVNKKTREIGATLTNNGDRLYFCSDREGGIGGFDIYVVNRLPNGKWGFPRNIGRPINTEGDEMYPFILDNERLLYFSSNGHPGMGGLDLFKSVMNDESAQWSQPENLGYPINTVNDDKSICFAENRRYAYLAQKRGDSYGDLDIYRLTFEKERAEYTLVSGLIMDTDSALVKTDILVEIFDDKSSELIGSYLMNKNTSKYHAVLPPGRYRLEILDPYGYETFSKTFVLLNKNDFRESLELPILLKPKP